jgi:drug/metabolite transporter (DMT)-like permease
VRRQAALGVAAIAACWGCIGLFVRWVDLPPVAIVASRCTLAAGSLALYFIVRRLRHGPSKRRWLTRTPWWGVALLGAGLAVHWLLLVAAQQRAPIGTVLLITYIAPVLVTLFAPWVLGELVPARTYVAAGLGLLGVAVLVRPGSGFGAGELLALAAGVTYAGITLFSKLMVGDIGGQRLAFLQLSVAALVLAPFAATASWGPPTASWWWLVLVGVLFTAVLGSAYLVFLDRLPASTVGVLTYMEPLTAVLVGWLFLGEEPSITMVGGGAMVVLAGIMVLPSAAGRRAAPDQTVTSGSPR